MIGTTRILAALALGMSLGAAPVTAQRTHDHQHGAVEFVVTCAPEVRADFQNAVALLHSFEYETARAAFQRIAERDADCGMAHWGVAMTYFHPLWAPPTPAELVAGRAAAEAAVRSGARTERERAYIDAIHAFYADADRRDHRTRAAAYRDAMERTAARFVHDDEAAIFYALAILGAAPPSDPTFAAQKKAAGILNGLLPQHQRHPGIAHYTIHAFDFPELAELALPAARMYASLAPGSPHALHMPTHIFTRLGLWDESIAANIACARAADERVARTHPGAASFEAFHCRDYLSYAYLQQGRDEQARQVLESLSGARRFDDPNFAVGYAALAVPARYMLERRDWAAAAAWTPRTLELPWEQFPEAQAITHFTRAIGAARTGDAATARAAASALEQLQRELAAKPPAGPYDWAGRVEALRLAAAAWLAYAEGRPDEAVRTITRAAEKEEEVGKHPVTPGPILPAREQLGDLLLELDRPAEALAAYERALDHSPGRFNALAGAARAARAAAEPTRAAEFYADLLDLAGDSVSRRGELAEARAYLASR